MPDTSSDPIEVVYVQLEADVAKYWQQIKQTITGTQRMIEQVKPPEIPPMVPSENETRGWMNKMKGWLGGLKGQWGDVSAAASGLKNEAANAAGALKNFATSGGGVRAVTASFSSLGSTIGGIASAGGPVTLLVGALAGVGLYLNSIKEKATEALAPLRSMLDPELLSASTWSMMNARAKGVDTAKTFEDFNTQFETLLGSAEAAQQRIAEYAKFGAKTPFNLPEIVQAGKLLQTFGGDALATGDSLTLVGDVASATGRPFTELAMWIGRTYSAMQSGRPFGEAAMRLQELGVLSGSARNKLEDLQKSGASSSEQWAAFVEIMSVNAGMMDKMSGTLGGLQSNYEDFQEQIALAGGTPVFKVEKEFLEDLIKDVEGEKQGVFAAHVDSIQSMATSIGEIKGSWMGFANEWKIAFLENLPWEQTTKLLESVSQLVQEFNNARMEAGAMEMPARLANGIGKVVESLQRGVENIQKLVKFGKMVAVSFRGWGETLKPIYTWLTSGLSIGIALVKKFLVNLTPVGIVFNKLSEVATKFFGATDTGLVKVAKGMAVLKGLGIAFIEAFRPALELMHELNQAVVAMLAGDFVKAGQHAKNALDKLKEPLIDFETATRVASESIKADFAEIDAMAMDTKETLEEVASEVPPLEMTVEIDEAAMGAAKEYADQLYEMQRDNAKKMEKLDEDSAKRIKALEDRAFEQANQRTKAYQENREKLFKDAADQREKLTKQAAEQEEKRRDEFDRQERQAKEQHYDEMNRMREEYLYQLEDAVKNRDARAIVDLRRNYNQQTDTAREQFEKGRDQRREDFDRQEQEARTGLERQLAQIDENTRARAEELDKRYNEEQAKLFENLQKQLNAEKEGLAERKQALQDSMKERLAQMADAMAKEGKMTEEQAAQILGTLNETFGIGGDIDKMMEDFIERRETKDRLYGEIEFSFKRAAGAGERSEAASAARGQEAARVYGGMGTTTTSSRPTERYEDDYQGGYGGGMASGGLFLARKPTLIQVGEGGEPELLSAAPMSSLNQLQPQGGLGNGKLEIEISGSAPPGIGDAQIDQMSAFLIDAIQDARITRKR